MHRKLGQVSIEYLLIFGFVTLSIIIVLGIAIHYSGSIKDNIKITQIENYAGKIISTSESVFYAGEPSKATVSAYLPESVDSIQITDNNLIITVQTSSGVNKLAYPSNVPISGILSSNGGVKKLEVVANDTAITITEV